MLEGHVTQNDTLTTLKEISEILVKYGLQIQQLYLEASAEQIEIIRKFEDTIQQLEDSTGNLRTRVLVGLTINLTKQRDELSNTLDKLQQTADIINNIDQLTNIATEVAEIAAGFMKL